MKYEILSINAPDLTVKFYFDDETTVTQTLGGKDLENKDNLELQLNEYAKALWAGLQLERSQEKQPAPDVDALVGKKIPVKAELTHE